MMHEHGDTLKNAVDGVAAVLTLGAVLQYLPAFAAFLSIVWTSIRILEWLALKFSDGQK